jgi:aminoglycoside phosphotransferase (APT) family kinase protein
MSRHKTSPASIMSGPTTKEILATVQELLGRHVGRARPVVAFEHRRSTYCTSFALEEVDVRLDDGRELRLMLKDVGPRAMSALARAAKPAFLLDPCREILTYRHLLGPIPGPPTFYGAKVDPGRKRYALLIERVDGRPLWQAGELTVWQAVARWLAGLHHHFSSQGRRPRPSGHLIVYDADYYDRWIQRALAFADRREPWRRRAIGQIADRYERVVERLTSLPTTLIHGELYASNVLIQETWEGVRVAPVDWEMAAVGPGLVDLAALVAGGWSDEQRTTIVRAYFDALPLPRAWEWDDFVRALNHCRLHLAVQWLGWSPDWSPPQAHAQDWLAEAQHLAGDLGV